MPLKLLKLLSCFKKIGKTIAFSREKLRNTNDFFSAPFLPKKCLCFRKVPPKRRSKAEEEPVPREMRWSSSLSTKRIPVSPWNTLHFRHFFQPLFIFLLSFLPGRRWLVFRADILPANRRGASHRKVPATQDDREGKLCQSQARQTHSHREGGKFIYYPSSFPIGRGQTLKGPSLAFALLH